MQQANELLYQILQVVGKIEQNQRQQMATPAAGGAGAGTGSIASKLGAGIKSFAGVRPSAVKSFMTFLDGMMETAKNAKDADVKKLQLISESISTMGENLPSLAEGLGDMGKLRTVRVQRAIRSLQLLYDFMEEAGDPRSVRRVDRAVKTFEKMGKSLRDIARPIKTITMSFAYLGLGILALAGSLVLTALILKLAKPTDVLIFLGALVVGVVLMFSILALA